MVKATFTLDDATMAVLRRTAERLRKPQSHVVREAVAEYAARADRLSESERRRLLDLLEGLQHQRPTRAAAAVDTELAAIRAARYAGGRRHRA